MRMRNLEGRDNRHIVFETYSNWGALYILASAQQQHQLGHKEKRNVDRKAV